MHVAVFIALVLTFIAIGARAESDSVADDAGLLAARGLLIPVAGVTRANLHDSFEERRGATRHEAIDITAPRGTPVVAAGDGRVVKLFKSVPGGLTVYQFDPDEKFAYYYAHLDRYAEGLAEGMLLKRGDPLGYVGSTGNASPASPHLHFAIFRLGPDRRWWTGAPINPYPLLNDPRR
jgi:murein DD-endopeptidase MepM/ murein hydrolase activator NlpD